MPRGQQGQGTAATRHNFSLWGGLWYHVPWLLNLEAAAFLGHRRRRSNNTPVLSGSLTSRLPSTRRLTSSEAKGREAAQGSGAVHRRGKWDREED